MLASPEPSAAGLQLALGQTGGSCMDREVGFARRIGDGWDIPNRSLCPSGIGFEGQTRQ